MAGEALHLEMYESSGPFSCPFIVFKFSYFDCRNNQKHLHHIENIFLQFLTAPWRTPQHSEQHQSIWEPVWQLWINRGYRASLRPGFTYMASCHDSFDRCWSTVYQWQPLNALKGRSAISCESVLRSLSSIAFYGIKNKLKLPLWRSLLLPRQERRCCIGTPVTSKSPTLA